jgi:argininosuccinate lyase
MKLWSKANTSTTTAVDQFTVGRDKEFDQMLAPFDVLGSIAHTKMLATVGLLTDGESQQLVKALQKIHAKVIAPDFIIPDGVEDIHSYVEFLLTAELGDTGKKIHSARSRNDQVLVDIKLFLRASIQELVADTLNCLHYCSNRANDIVSIYYRATRICNWLCLLLLDYGLARMPKA